MENNGADRPANDGQKYKDDQSKGDIYICLNTPQRDEYSFSACTFHVPFCNLESFEQFSFPAFARNDTNQDSYGYDHRNGRRHSEQQSLPSLGNVMKVA